MLLPTLPGVARALVGLLSDGTLLIHAAYTLARVLLGFASRGRGRPAARDRDGAQPRGGKFRDAARERADADPSLAWVPVFILWFGLGDR